jgi:hypothetical protein
VAVFVAGDGGGGADIGARSHFGHEHGALHEGVQILGGEAGDVAVDEVPGAESVDDARSRVGHRDGAVEAELGLGEEEGESIFSGVREGARPAERGAMRDGGKGEIGEADALHFTISGVVVNGLDIAAVSVAVEQDGWVLVGYGGQIVESAAGQGAEAGIIRAKVLEQIGIEAEAESRNEVGIVIEEVKSAVVAGQKGGGGAGVGP